MPTRLEWDKAALRCGFGVFWPRRYAAELHSLAFVGDSSRARFRSSRWSSGVDPPRHPLEPLGEIHQIAPRIERLNLLSQLSQFCGRLSEFLGPPQIVVDHFFPRSGDLLGKTIYRIPWFPSRRSTSRRPAWAPVFANACGGLP